MSSERWTSCIRGAPCHRDSRGSLVKEVCLHHQDCSQARDLAKWVGGRGGREGGREEGGGREGGGREGGRREGGGGGEGMSMFNFFHISDIEIKLVWFSKLLEALTQGDQTTGNMVANYANISTALDLLTFLLTVLPHQTILNGFRTLHKGVNICMTSNSTKVVRYVHTLLARLISMFPTDLGTYVRGCCQGHV